MPGRVLPPITGAILLGAPGENAHALMSAGRKGLLHHGRRLLKSFSV